MTSEIKAQIIDGDKKGSVYTYSVKEYADYLLAHDTERDDWKQAAPLVRAMLGYGENAENYFSDAEALDALDVAIPEKSSVVENLPAGITFDGATLSLKSKTTLTLYFVKGDEADDIELSMDGKTAGVDYELAQNGNEYVIRIRNISAAELNNDFTVRVNGTGTVTYSPLTYCYKAQTSSNAKLVNTVKALYLYWIEANYYFNHHQEG